MLDLISRFTALVYKGSEFRNQKWAFNCVLPCGLLHVPECIVPHKKALHNIKNLNQQWNNLFHASRAIKFNSFTQKAKPFGS